MRKPVEAPRVEDLLELHLEVKTVDDEFDSTQFTLESNHEDRVLFSWDTVTGTSYVRWTREGRTVYVMTRELLQTVSVNPVAGGIEVNFWSAAQDLTSRLTVTVGDHVEIDDVLLEA